jgi:hypothetical protein
MKNFMHFYVGTKHYVILSETQLLRLFFYIIKYKFLKQYLRILILKYHLQMDILFNYKCSVTSCVTIMFFFKL